MRKESPALWVVVAVTAEEVDESEEGFRGRRENSEVGLGVVR